MKREYDKRSEIPQWKNAIVVGMLGLSTFLSGCSDTYAYVTKNGPQYFGKSPSEWHINHEQCHMERLLQMGEKEYWEKYWSDIQFAIDEEARCDFPDPINHPAIMYRVKTVQPLPEPDPIVFSYTLSK